MRFGLRTALTALLVSAALPASAAASSSTTIPIHVPRELSAVSGPALAGDAVAFGRSTDGGYEVVIRHGAQAAISRVDVPGLKGAYRRFTSARLEASDRRLVLSLRVTVCDSRTKCDGGTFRLLYHAVLTGDLGGGDLALLGGCTSEAQCKARPQCLSALNADVWADAVALETCSGGVRVRDFAAGADPKRRSYPAFASSPRIAGDFLAFARPTSTSSSDVLVTNWRSGQDAYAITARGPYDLQANGTLFYGVPGGGHAWASPSEPAEHVVDNDPLFTKATRVASDLGAYATDIDAFPLDVSGSRFVVRDLNAPPNPEDPPAVAGYQDPYAIGSMDFDGSRLAWIVHVCRHRWISVWDIADQRPPELPRVACPIPRVVPGSAKLDQSGRFRVTLECPTDPPVGCVGLVAAKAPKNVTWARYSFGGGERRTKQLNSHAPCRDASGRVRAELLFSEGYYHGEPVVAKRRTVTVHGQTGSVRAC